MKLNSRNVNTVDVIEQLSSTLDRQYIVSLIRGQNISSRQYIVVMDPSIPPSIPYSQFSAVAGTPKNIVFHALGASASVQRTGDLAELGRKTGEPLQDKE